RDRGGGAELGHRPGRGRPALAGTAGRAGPAPRHQPQAASPRRAGGPHAIPGARAPPAEPRAHQRGGVRRRDGRLARSPPAARAAGAPPSGAAQGPPAAARRGAAPHLPAARRRRAGPWPDDRVPGRLVVDGGREGDLVEGGRADAPRDRAPAAPALPLHLLLLRRHAAVHARSEPARAPPGPGGPGARRRRVLPGRRDGFRDAAGRRAGDPGGGALPARRRGADHRRRVSGAAGVARALRAPGAAARFLPVLDPDRRRFEQLRHARPAERPGDQRLAAHRRRGPRSLRHAVTPGVLTGVRVLDLADRSGALAGRLLAGLGADVLLLEPPAGSAMRAIPPFIENVPAPERRLFFWFYAAG